jgi:hypothetical protein
VGTVLRVFSAALFFFVGYMEVVEIGNSWWSDFLKIGAIAVGANIVASLSFGAMFTAFRPLTVSNNPASPGTKIIKFNPVFRSWELSITALVIIIVLPIITNSYL